MRKVFCFILALFSTILLSAQSFEGKIIYTNAFKSKTPSITDEQFTSMMGARHEYFVKQGDYKTNANGTLVQWQLYRNSDNKLYTKMANSEAAFWNDGAVNQDEVLKVELNKQVTEVLGYKCDEIIVTCKSGVQKYYYNSGFPVDVMAFEKHKFGNWYAFVSNSKSLPLKILVDNPQFTLEQVAVEVTPMKLDKEMFSLPANMQITKSPY